MKIANRTLFIHDNLPVLRGIPSDSVDLIATDPPFNTKRQFNAPMGSKAAKAKFDDRWRWDDVAEEWSIILGGENPAIRELIEAAAVIEGGSVNRDSGEIDTGRIKNSMAAFLCWMAPRLIEMRRVLRPGGSLYLHTDDAADSYLRLLLDAVFGRSNFHNRIVWKRHTGRSDAKRFGRVSDTILFYSNGAHRRTWNTQYVPHDPEYVKKSYRHRDSHGRWQVNVLTAPGKRTGESGEAWRGINPTKQNRHWATPIQGGMSDFIRERNLIPGWPNGPGLESVQARLDALDAAGLIHWTRNGTPSMKRYLASTKGRAVQDVFVDIGKLGGMDREKIGWPTQKPLALYRRIIQASSNPGDVVLDPFAGCATTCVAAEQLDRQWIGIDIDPTAADVTLERLRNETSSVFEQDPDAVRVRHAPPKQIDMRGVSDADMRRIIHAAQGGFCANRFCTAGQLREVDLELDHRLARARGGSDSLDNRIGLCSDCNRRKGSKAWKVFIGDEARDAAMANIGMESRRRMC